MLQYTEKAFDKMLKRELIPIVLSLQNKITEDNNAVLKKCVSLIIILLNFRLN